MILSKSIKTPFKIAQIEGGIYDQYYICQIQPDRFNSINKITDTVVKTADGMKMNFNKDEIQNVCVGIAENDISKFTKNEMILYEEIIGGKPIDKSLGLMDGKIKLYPVDPNDNNQTDVLYISGNMGSGKSYLSNQYLQTYKKIYPKNKIYLYSRSDPSLDPSFDCRGIYSVILGPDLLSFDFQIEDYKDSLFIFDDYAAISDNKLLKKVESILKDVISHGRKFKIHILVTGHETTNYIRTKLIINNATRYIIFPASSQKGYFNLMQNYLGIKKKAPEVLTLGALPYYSRWICLMNANPGYILTESRALDINLFK